MDRTTTQAPSNRVRLVVGRILGDAHLHLVLASRCNCSERSGLFCILRSRNCRGGGRQSCSPGSSSALFSSLSLFDAVYVESCSMFTRGGVYRVVKEALGGTFAKLSVSALMFDYILTGPISGVSAGQYITGLLNELMMVGAVHGWLPHALMRGPHLAAQMPMNGTAAFFALAVTIFYWWQNIKGIEESSDRALDVMKITTVMVVILLILGNLFRDTYWCAPSAIPNSLKSALQPRCIRCFPPYEVCRGTRSVRSYRCVRTFCSGDERRGVSRAGQSRDRASQTKEPEARGNRNSCI